MDYLEPKDNKFHKGNGDDGKHYWLTPPDLMNALQTEFAFDFDPCPYPKPEEFDGLTCEWGSSNYVNPPFGSIMHNGKKKGPTAWMRKAIEENKKGKRVVVVYPVDKWVLMMLEAGAKVRNLGDVKWCATEDGTQGNGTGRHVACFVLDTSNEWVEMLKKAQTLLRGEPVTCEGCLREKSKGKTVECLGCTRIPLNPEFPRKDNFKRRAT